MGPLEVAECSAACDLACRAGFTTEMAISIVVAAGVLRLARRYIAEWWRSYSEKRKAKPE